uniref:Putative secreted protein n=1 Tax=Anopheles darlingi TaxID=43151 RepID=A0A2M4D5Z0_ANODA
MSCGPFAVLSCHFISPLVTLSLSLSLSLTLALPLFLPYTRPREGSLTHFGIAYRWSSPFLLLASVHRTSSASASSPSAVHRSSGANWA